MAANGTIYASVEKGSFNHATHVDGYECVDTPNDQKPTVDESNARATTPDRPVEALNLRLASTEDFQRLLRAYEAIMEADDLLYRMQLEEMMRQLCPRQEPEGSDIDSFPVEAKVIVRSQDLASKRLAAAYDKIAEETKRHANTPGGPSAKSNEGSAARPVALGARSIGDFMETIAAMDMVTAYTTTAALGPNIFSSGINLKKLHLALAVERMRRASSRKAKPEERWLTKNATGGYGTGDKNATSNRRQ